MNRSTFQLGLTGFPLGHSLSPTIHRAALEACGLSGDYALYPVQPTDQKGLAELLDRIRSGELHGLNVTIPHKQTVIPLLDVLTSAAQTIGAVNTTYMKEGRLVGDNTDAPGFLANVRCFLGEQKREQKTALILGAGGSARAVTYALTSDGWTVTIAARRLEQARELAAQFGWHPLQLANLPPSPFNLIVNTTPLGMSPNVEASPWPDGMPFPPQAAVYDLVYNPRESQLVRTARAAGLKATTGLGMLVEQAALAFERWTGCDPDRARIYHALEQA